MATILHFRQPEFAVLNFHRGLVNIVSRRSTRRYVIIYIIKLVETKSGRNRRGNRLDPKGKRWKESDTLEAVKNFSNPDCN